MKGRVFNYFWEWVKLCRIFYFWGNLLVFFEKISRFDFSVRIGGRVLFYLCRRVDGGGGGLVSVFWGFFVVCLLLRGFVLCIFFFYEEKLI